MNVPIAELLSALKTKFAPHAVHIKAKLQINNLDGILSKEEGIHNKTGILNSIIGAINNLVNGNDPDGHQPSVVVHHCQHISYL
ncbi:hypothetical protein ACFLXL_01250 [Chloroflexota bacterium]